MPLAVNVHVIPIKSSVLVKSKSKAKRSGTGIIKAYPLLEIKMGNNRLQSGRTVNRVNRFCPKGGHLATLTKLNIKLKTGQKLTPSKHHYDREPGDTTKEPHLNGQ